MHLLPAHTDSFDQAKTCCGDVSNYQMASGMKTTSKTLAAARHLCTIYTIESTQALITDTIVACCGPMVPAKALPMMLYGDCFISIDCRVLLGRSCGAC